MKSTSYFVLALMSKHWFVSRPWWTFWFFRLVKGLTLVMSKEWPSQNISTLKRISYCDRYDDANSEYDSTAAIEMKSKRLSKFLGPWFSYLTAWYLQHTMIARIIVVEQQRTRTNGASRNPCHSFDTSSCPPQFWNVRQS